MEQGSKQVAAAELEMPVSFDLLYADDIWIGDTGASCHSSKSKRGASNERSSGSASLGHAGEAVKATSTFDLKGRFVRKDGGLGMKATLTECSYNASHNFNLISLPRLLCNKWKIVKGDATGITVKHPSGDVIDFDIVVRTGKGAIFACRFIRDVELAGVSTGAGTVMNIAKAHGLLGHGDEESTRQSAKELGWVITRGKLDPCLHCARSKAKQKNVCKASDKEKAKEPGERMYLDLSTIKVLQEDKTEFELKRKYWKTMVDEASGKKFCDFTSTKNGMVERTCEFLHITKQRGRPVRKVRLDPSGENHKLAKRAQSVDWKELQPIDFEFTSRDTPQHNNLAELSFPYIAGKSRAMMGAAHVPAKVRGKVAPKAVECACKLDGLRVVTLNGKTATRDVHWYGKNPSWANNLRTWGEAGVVKNGKDDKTGDGRKAMISVGSPNNCETNSVEMWNPETN